MKIKPLSRSLIYTHDYTLVELSKKIMCITQIKNNTDILNRFLPNSMYVNEDNSIRMHKPISLYKSTQDIDQSIYYQSHNPEENIMIFTSRKVRKFYQL